MAGGVSTSQSANPTMQQPRWQPSGSHNVTAHCTLLQQLSQDLLDKTPAQLNTGCDSSDCFLCQGQRQFCNQAITDTVCPLLGRRRLPSNACSQLSTAEPQCGTASLQHQQLNIPDVQQDASGQRKRLRLSPRVEAGSSDAAAAAAADPSAALAGVHLCLASDGTDGHRVSAHEQQLQQQFKAPGPHAEAACQQEQVHLSAQQQHQQQEQEALPAPCRACRDQGSRSWQWRPEFAVFDGPAPARLAEVARLQSAADASAGHCAGRSDRISGLEFSPDGQLLAAAGVSKQIGLYPLAALAELQAAPSEVACAVPGCPGNTSSSSQRQQRMQQQLQQQQQQTVPTLPPVATVRLPGKVSSIAFCPDMQGVLSIGDYDGTLTQVHVASGHYLSEVDAHAGRRIWSISHSKLRRNFAATASDDCTARLWGGYGLNTHIATITAPGKPAVCSVDFSSSNEHVLALAAADTKVYLFDLRQLQQPLVSLQGHRRPVSYAKFFGGQQLVSASIDGTLAVWDLAPLLGLAADAASAAAAAPTAAADSSSRGLSDAGLAASPANSACCSSDSSAAQQPVPSRANGSDGSRVAAHPAAGTGMAAADDVAAAGAGQQQPWKVFRGHTNEKNFVGLAVEPCSGLMAVGSETSEVFSYHTSWSSPLARFDLSQQQQQLPQGHGNGLLQQQMQQPVAATWSPQQQQQQQQQSSVSAVAWQPSCAVAGRSQAGICSPATLLAAATSSGECRLLSLLHC